MKPTGSLSAAERDELRSAVMETRNGVSSEGPVLEGE